MAAERSRASRAAGLRRVPGLAMGGSSFDKLIHEPLRLGIVSALAANEKLSFAELREMTRATDGNLSVHARKLESAGYLSCKKTFRGRTPRTEFRLTAKGRKAFERYLDHMESVIRAARGGTK